MGKPNYYHFKNNTTKKITYRCDIFTRLKNIIKTENWYGIIINKKLINLVLLIGLYSIFKITFFFKFSFTVEYDPLNDVSNYISIITIRVSKFLFINI